MSKVLIEVYNPASGKTYDVLIPLESKLYEVSYLLSNTISELSEGYYRVTDQSILCNRKTGELYDINSTIEELGFKNGEKLMLL